MSWDDGKHTKVKRVQLTFDDVIRSIQVEYEGTTLQSQRRGTTVGTKSDGFTLSPDEYITDVSGYSKTTFSGDIITALTFKTNKKTYGPYGNKTREYFSASAPKDSQIAGFLGTSGNALNYIDVHFAPISIIPKPVVPDTKPGGSDTKPVDPDTKPTKPDGSDTKPTKPDGSDTKPTKPDGPDTKPVDPDTKPDGSGKTGLIGGKGGGKAFDDGVFDGVKKITVAADEYSVTYIKIEYVKDGKVETREHGTIRGTLKEFSVDYPNEYITAVGGTYDHIFTYDTTLITSLYFTTSKGSTSPLFGEKSGENFDLKGENGGKLVGFHGRGDTALDAIGAYFDVPGKTRLTGGKGGNAFDDGVFDGAKKITVGADEFSVTYIKIEYEKYGKVVTREHGEIRGELKEYTVPNYPDDYITAVGGSYDHVFTYDTTLITSLYFTTSRGFTSPLSGEIRGEEFNLKGENGGKLVGLHGLGGTAINAIGAYFDTGSQGGGGDSKPDGSETNPGKNDLKPDASGKTGLVGGESGNTFDDGVFDGVKKITVGANEDYVTYIKIEYVKDGKAETREHGEISGELKEFLVDYPKQNITTVGGSYDHNFSYDTTLITSLYFETSNGITSPLFGKKDGENGENFTLKGKNGEKLVGLHGRGGTAINAIGAYFDTGSKPVNPETKPDDSSSGTNSDSSTQKLDAQGGKGGNEWDDGGDHDGVTKITVTAGGLGVEQIRFDYLKNGQPKEGPVHGVKGRRSYDERFEIAHPKEYIVSVKGWYDSSNVIQGLEIKTNTKTTDYFPSPFSGDGTEFSLEVKDKKIVGFHGFADSGINSLGAYFAPITSKTGKKLKAVGGDQGAAWDDGVFDGVREIHVGQNQDGVSFVKIDYNKGSQTVLGDGHGQKSLAVVETFKLENPSEYITEVGVYYDKVQIEGRGVTLVTSLIFKTSKNRESTPFGMTGGEYTELKEEGHKIVGFHGKASDWIHQIGVHVAPVTN
ncbi:unnamed protein product [Thlaspi arvense]|uniref:Jacalin-type lectin domain-containing protein n=1 Tax=Thlaspi arvense TaxID=13288 RepID=A0AAU9REA1_THLAR|nr:unnamed protein product [Thlaspi arvense]